MLRLPVCEGSRTGPTALSLAHAPTVDSLLDVFGTLAAGDESSEGEPTPGKNKVQQAVPKQRAAAGQLKEFKPAKQKQQDAKDDLDAAKEALEEALAQLRQQLQDEVLRALEERFTAMLARQRELTIMTKTVDASRKNILTADGQLPTALVSKIAALAEGEGELELETIDALKLLEEDGERRGRA